MIGFSTTGKTRVARELAKHFGWHVVDTDEEIVREAGKPIPQIFAADGEAAFRAIERQVLARACKLPEVVVATGGGAVVDPSNRDLIKRSGMVVCLEASPQTIYRRLQEDVEVSGAIRPLLAGPDPLGRITELKGSREAFYAVADWTVHTDNLSVGEVCQEIMRGRHYWRRSWQNERGDRQGQGVVAEVVTPTSGYPIFVGWDSLTEIGPKLRDRGLGRTVHVISDETVWSIYGGKMKTSLLQAGIDGTDFRIAPGEASKTLETAAKAYDWLVDCRAEREHCILALGGGVVGDLAGFVAATFLRGMPLVHVPTSLIAMVDAAIGGKTAVDHTSGKNLIGAFYQPRIVWCDVHTLATLPARERTSGWAEVIKHGAILDKRLFDFLGESADRLLGLDPGMTTEAIGRSVEVKAGIVSEDEKETGRRTLLNYGHTIGHALEAVTGYRRFLHGEAVSIGMAGAAMLSREMGLASEETVERQLELLKTFGLPTHCSGVSPGTVLEAMELDKKVRNKSVRWVLVERIGSAIIRDDVPDEKVSGVLEELLHS